MKKIVCLLFFLTGCMMAPVRSFQVDPDTEVYPVQAESVEVVPMGVHFDMLPHIENQLPTSPEEAVQQWAQKHLQAVASGHKKLWIIIECAEMLKTDIPNENFFQMDEESYTLNYQFLVQLREGEQVVHSMPIEGKGYVTLKKKASLASKEKGWAWLIQKMLTHLKTKMKSDLKDVFME